MSTGHTEKNENRVKENPVQTGFIREVLRELCWACAVRAGGSSGNGSMRRGEEESDLESLTGDT